MLRWAGWEVASFRGRHHRRYSIGRNRHRNLDGVLDLQLSGSGVETGVVLLAALRLHRRAGRLGLRRRMAMMRRHVMFMRGRAVRTVVVGLQRHRAGLQSEIQPHGREQSEGWMAPGSCSVPALHAASQVVVSVTILGSIANVPRQDYWYHYG